MKNILDEIEPEITFTDQEIFTQIWTQPRSVLKYINDNHYDKFVIILMVFAGIASSFNNAAVRNLGDQLPFFSLLGVCIIGGGLLGWISYYIYAALLSFTGKWIQGQGDTTSLFRILAYAMIPTIFGLVLLVPQLAIYGAELYKEDGDIFSAGFAANIIFWATLFFEFLLSICTIIFIVVGVSEVQKLSIGMTILNLIMPIFLIAIPLLILNFLARAL